MPDNFQLQFTLHKHKPVKKIKDVEKNPENLTSSITLILHLIWWSPFSKLGSPPIQRFKFHEKPVGNALISFRIRYFRT